MTSSAHKLGSELRADDVSSVHESGKVVLSSLDDFIRTIAIHPKFRAYEITTRDNDMVRIIRDGLSQTFVFPSCWQHLERRMPFLEQAGIEGSAVVCVGTASDLEDFPEDLRRPDIQQLSIPIFELSLLSMVNSIHNLLTMASHSSAAAH